MDDGIGFIQMFAQLKQKKHTLQTTISMLELEKDELTNHLKNVTEKLKERYGERNQCDSVINDVDVEYTSLATRMTTLLTRDDNEECKNLLEGDSKLACPPLSSCKGQNLL